MAPWCSPLDSIRRPRVIRAAIEPAAVPIESALSWPTAPGAAAAPEMPGDARTSVTAHRKAERREPMTG